MNVYPQTLSSPKRLIVRETCHGPHRACTKDATTAEVGRHIVFDPATLDSFDVKGFQPLHYDLLLLSAAVEFADRRWERPQDWSRSLNVTVPVIDFTTWQKPDVAERLRSVLRHLTGDTWHFTFVHAKNLSPVGSRQRALGFPKTKTFVIAYSDGLDSRCVSALSGEKGAAVCIRVANKRHRLRTGDYPFDQIPFNVRGYRSRESSFRSRGFQFAAVTAIAAHLSDVTRIMVPESGQGALGPVLLPLHNVYADYRAHPTFFRKMEAFITAALGHRVHYEQPRLWYTKGQTLRAFLDLPGNTEAKLTNTRSCWQNRRIVNTGGSKKQCGLCAACLLRRLSLHAAGITETPDAYVVSDLSTADLNHALSGIPQKADRDIMIEYGSVGARHLQHLADMVDLPDDALRVHVSEIAAAMRAPYQETLNKLRAFLVTHAQEWKAFLAAQGKQSFMKSWMDGGRRGGVE